MPVYAPDRFPFLYDEIRRGALLKDSFVLVFVANDVDAICAARVLVGLLEADHVRTTMIPVSSYTDLAAANAAHVENREELRTIVTINCGGMVDLKEFFSLPSEQTRVYVMDSHRPLNLDNMFGNPQIIVLADEGFENQDGMQKVHEAYDALEYAGDSDEEENSGSDSDDDRASTGRRSRSASRSRAGSPHSRGGRSRSGSRSRSNSRSRSGSPLRNEDATGDEDGEGGGDLEQEGKRRRSGSRSPRPEKRRRSDSPRTARRALRQQMKDYRRTVAEYYASGTSHAKSAAGIAYLMALKLGRERSEALWMAIVSLAYQFGHGLVSLRHYATEIKDLYKPEVLKFGSGLLGAAAADENSQPDSQNGETRSSGIYYAEDEFQFTLYRHWNLFDAMQHSEYVCTKLGLWKDKGRKKMQSMLAEMGLPLEQVRQPPSEMNKRMRDEIPDKFFADGVAAKYDLQDLRLPAFVRRYGVRGYRGMISATDMVFALDALLDGGDGWARRDADGAIVVDEAVVGGVPDGQGHNSVRAESRSWRDIQVQHTAITSGQRTGVAAITRRRDGGFGVSMVDREGLPSDLQWKDNWYSAYDGLENIDHLLFGIHLAKHLQAAVLRCATTILDKGGIRTLKRFRLIKIDTGSATSIGRIMPKDCALLSRSVPWLNRVANIFSKAFREYAARSELPIILAALNPNGETYLMAGYPPLAASASRGKNPFGLIFQECCQRTGARAKHDNFETHVMEVKAEDFPLVFGELQRMEF